MSVKVDPQILVVLLAHSIPFLLHQEIFHVLTLRIFLHGLAFYSQETTQSNKDDYDTECYYNSDQGSIDQPFCFP